MIVVGIEILLLLSSLCLGLSKGGGIAVLYRRLLLNQ